MSLQITEIDDTAAQHAPPAALGIDLGTTHSLVAVVQDGNARLLDLKGSAGTPTAQAHSPCFLMPSLVGCHDGTWVAGFKAASAQKHPATHTTIVASIKRLMGCDTLAQAPKDFPAPLCEDAQGRLCIRFGDKHLTPTEAATYLLQELVRCADHALAKRIAKPLRQAVITVPAYFDERARAATRTAAERAGLEVLRLISEPTAAALAYGLDEGVEGLYGVFDWGGGTFDFSLLSMEKGVFNVKAVGGDTHLGGDDIDRAVQHFFQKQGTACTLPQARAIKEAVKEESVREDAMGAETGVEKGSDTKTATQAARKAEINTPPPLTLTTAQFEQLAHPFITRTLHLTAQVLEDADIQPQQLHGFILAGGATRTLGLQRQLQKTFGRPLLCTLNPDHVVALGAARQAQALARGDAQHLLLDITPLSLGIETMGGHVEKLIARNTRIPVHATQTFTTHADNQKHLLLHVLQGESEAVAQCRSLARFELRDLPPLPAKEARIEVTFQLDSDGLLHVTATEQTTGKNAHVAVKPTYQLSMDTARTLLSV